MKTATIIINDEVNCKIQGLDLAERKRLSDKFKFEIPGARHLPSVKLGRWDGKISFFQLGGTTYINLLSEILPVLEEMGYDVELQDNRDYKTQFTFPEITAQSFSNITWPKGHVCEGQPIVLRDYQIAAINNYLNNVQSLQEIATGAGKTLITAALSKSCEQYGRTIIIVPNRDLVKQTEADYINLGLDVGVFYGGRHEFGKTHTICTWQSLNSLYKKTKKGEAPIPIGEFIEGVVCVIVDEVHAAKADALKSMLTGLFAKTPIRWGLTGTIPKENFEFFALRCSIGEVLGRLSANELQTQGVLANCHIHVKQLVDYVEFKDYQAELRYLLETTDRLHYIAGMIQEISKTGNTLVLIDRIEPGQALANCIPGAVFINGSTKSADRKEQYDSIAVTDGTVTVATYGIAAVGINVPRIFNMVLIEPGKSFVRVIQSIGRGIRKADDKDFVDIYDITSTCKFAKRHLTKRKVFYKEAKYDFNIEKVNWQ